MLEKWSIDTRQANDNSVWMMHEGETESIRHITKRVIHS